MKLLIDTNIFLEIILGQDKSEEAKALLEKAEVHNFFISDYSLHSIGTILFRQKKNPVFRQFLDDMVVTAGVVVISLSVEDMSLVIETANKFKLDFDDAYQYAVAKKHTLKIVSFDSDFDRVEGGRTKPADILR